MIIARHMKHSFAVIGIPVSTQSSPETKRIYQTAVAKSANKNVIDVIKDSKGIRIELDWFSEDFRNKPDVDNIIKPIQDALKGIVFLDDNQVESVIARRHDTSGMIRFHEEPLCIIEPLLTGHSEYVFIRIY